MAADAAVAGVATPVPAPMKRRSVLRGWAGLLIATACVAAVGGAWWMAREAIDAARTAFETDARIAHRVLSQRAVQHDAILDTLTLLQPARGESAEQRLPAVYPQVLRVLRRERGSVWAGVDANEAAALDAGESASRTQARAALGAVDFAQGRYWLVRADETTSFALLIDARAPLEPGEWPLPAATPVRALLQHAGQPLVLNPGHLAERGWRFDFTKRLATESQPFDVVLSATLAPTALPWPRLAFWLAACSALALVAAQWQRQRQAARRHSERARIDQVSRLNAMGELAAGIAHELNQPLTAVLANTGAAARLLGDDEPDLASARHAMSQAAAQAQRAGDVLARLRRLIERPDRGAQTQQVALAPLLTRAIDLLDAEWRELGVHPLLQCEPAALTVQADAVALEQIVHNLLTNAQQALAQVPAAERRLTVAARIEGANVLLSVRDSGPGFAPDALPHVFEPFFSTREGGLGLGLSLSESLALAQGGALRAEQALPRGALFTLALPRAASR